MKVPCLSIKRRNGFSVFQAEALREIVSGQPRNSSKQSHICNGVSRHD